VKLFVLFLSVKSLKIFPTQKKDGYGEIVPNIKVLKTKSYEKFYSMINLLFNGIKF